MRFVLSTIAVLCAQLASATNCTVPPPWQAAAAQGIPQHVYFQMVQTYLACVGNNPPPGSPFGNGVNPITQGAGMGYCDRYVQSMLANSPGDIFSAAKLKAECHDRQGVAQIPTPPVGGGQPGFGGPGFGGQGFGGGPGGNPFGPGSPGVIPFSHPIGQPGQGGGFPGYGGQPGYPPGYGSPGYPVAGGGIPGYPGGNPYNVPPGVIPAPGWQPPPPWYDGP